MRAKKKKIIVVLFPASADVGQIQMNIIHRSGVFTAEHNK